MAVGKTTPEQNRHYELLDAMSDKGNTVIVPAPVVNVSVSPSEVVIPPVVIPPIPPVRYLAYRHTVTSRDSQGRILTMISEPLYE